MILFEGNDLVVHSHCGETDYLLITFVGAWETKNATRTFFAEPVVVKNKINCIGVTAKEDYWYISPEKSDVIEKINEISKNFEKIIIIGMSMGAHPAIAWSRDLNADTVLAFSPKWSLDPEECNVAPEYLGRNFRDGMQGMGIRAHQTQGRILVAFDPLDVWDSYYANIIYENVPNVSFVKTYYSGHLVTDSLSGSREFGKIINALAYSETEEITRTITQIRRKNETNLAKKYQLSLEKHPYLTYRLITSTSIKKLRNKQKLFQEQANIGRNIYFLLAGNREKEAIYLYEFSKNIIYQDKFEFPLIQNNDFDSYYIISSHGYKVGYDLKHCVINAQDLFLPTSPTVPLIAKK